MQSYDYTLTLIKSKKSLSPFEELNDFNFGKMGGGSQYNEHGHILIQHRCIRGHVIHNFGRSFLGHYQLYPWFFWSMIRCRVEDFQRNDAFSQYVLQTLNLDTTLLARYGSVHFLHGMIRFLNSTLCFLNSTVRFLNSTLCFLNGTVCFLNCTVCFLHVFYSKICDGMHVK